MNTKNKPLKEKVKEYTENEKLNGKADVGFEKEISPGQVYYHYKNPKHLYEIVCVARHSETLEEMVVYRAIYEDEFPLGRVWARTKKMFLEKVNFEGKEMDRFTRVK